MWEAPGAAGLSRDERLMLVIVSSFPMCFMMLDGSGL